MLKQLDICLKEALQKYPEQSFAQKFSLCNRQKFSGRKIKEGFWRASSMSKSKSAASESQNDPVIMRSFYYLIPVQEGI